MPTIPEEQRLGENIVRNFSLSGGINQRISGRLLADDESTDNLNQDIGIPGNRKKVLDPLTIAALGNAPHFGGPATIIAGLTPFLFNNTTYLLTASAGHIYLVDGFNQLEGGISTIPGPAINANSRVTFVLANGVQYFLDGVGSLYSTDGTVILALTLLDASGNSISSINDMIWFMNQMWYVSGDFLYFSAVNQPTTINDAAINVAVGDGGALKRVLPYRNGLLILFKYGTNGGQGSIHLCDVSSGQPALFQLNTTPFFDHLNLCSPQCVTRMGFDQNAEVVFATIEGLRTDAFTALDRLVTPSLPFSQNLPTTIANINPAALDSAFTVFWNDQLLWFVPVNGVNTDNSGVDNVPSVANYPTEVLAYTTKVPKDNVLNGWAIITNHYASCACVASINGNPPALFIGKPGSYNTGGAFVQQAFYGDAGSNYSETSKRIDHGFPGNEKVGRRLMVFLKDDHRGAITVNEIFDDGTTQTVGTYTPTGTMFPLKFPVAFGVSQEQNVAFDLHFNGLNGNYKRYYDKRINITSSSLPSILGWELNSVIYPPRYQDLNAAIPTPNTTPTPILVEAGTPTKIAFE